MTAATDDGFGGAGQGREPERKAEKARRAAVRSPRRWTRADERAVVKMLAEHDDLQTRDLRRAICRYEWVAADAKARLGRRHPLKPADTLIEAARLDAMQSVLSLIGGMLGETQNPYRVLRAVIEMTSSAEDIYYGMPAWLRAAEPGEDRS